GRGRGPEIFRSAVEEVLASWYWELERHHAHRPGLAGAAGAVRRAGGSRPLPAAAHRAAWAT
ncbi:hypothetical protein, partial [Streptomyces sp. ISL-94]|uniref:hypothetical protein n=1 Tax=Streptomyces sp. ISL-94 TaxID=2819190 RepID=UPI001BE66428